MHPHFKSARTSLHLSSPSISRYIRFESIPYPDSNLTPFEDVFWNQMPGEGGPTSVLWWTCPQPDIEPLRAGNEAGVEQRTRHRAACDGDTVHRGDEQPCAAGWMVLAVPVDAGHQEIGEGLCDVAARGFVFGEKDLYVRIAATKIRDQRAVAENHARADTAGEGRGRVAAGGPTQQRAVGVRRIGRGEHQHFAAIALALGTQATQQVDGRGHCEL